MYTIPQAAYKDKINKIIMDNTHKAHQDSGIFKTGDLVIGSSDPAKSVYSATGSKILSNGVSIYGDAGELEAQGDELTKSALRSGGKLLRTTSQTDTKTNKKTVSKKNKVKQVSMNTYLDSTPAAQTQPEIEEVQYSIQFENSFGKMKAKVEHLVQHELAYMLIFKDEDSVVFEPKVGETLILHTPQRERVEVYYPGVTFDSPVNSKKFMILFKVPEENQE